MRKIRINLYGSEFKPKRIILSLPQMLLIWLCTALIVGGVYYVTYQKKVTYFKQSQHLAAQLNELNDNLAQTQSLVAQMSPDPALTERTKSLRVLLDTKKQLMGFLSDRTDLKSHGYAGFMEAMARIKSNGVAIQHFSIHGVKADIEGEASSGRAVPQWVSQFRNYQELSPVVFGGLKLNRDADSEVIHFQLNSENEKKKNKDEKDELED